MQKSKVTVKWLLRGKILLGCAKVTLVLLGVWRIAGGLAIWENKKRKII
ncbi:hypothetical protein [Moraxella caviae]|nr:hypothetical protein [Moraxella caviae]